MDMDLVIPNNAIGIVIFSHGSGSGRFSPRNQYVARVLEQAQIGTLLFDLLTPEEDQDYEMRFNIPLLTQRLIDATKWVQQQPQAQGLALGYFGASYRCGFGFNGSGPIRQTHSLCSQPGRAAGFGDG